MLRFSFSHCSTARMSVMRLSSSSTLVSGAIMSDIIDSDGPRPPPGLRAGKRRAERREPHHAPHAFEHFSGRKPGKPGKGGVESVVSVMLVASMHRRKEERRPARV